MRSPLLLALLLAPPAFAQDGAGEAAFVTRCAACHGVDGGGTPGFAPPLTNAEVWKGLGPEAPKYVAGVTLAGLAGTLRSEGQLYAGLIMPPQAQISNEEMTLIGTYVLQELGKLDEGLDPAVVEATRADPPSHADLLALRPEVE